MINKIKEIYKNIKYMKKVFTAVRSLKTHMRNSDEIQALDAEKIENSVLFFINQYKEFIDASRTDMTLEEVKAKGIEWGGSWLAEPYSAFVISIASIYMKEKELLLAAKAYVEPTSENISNQSNKYHCFDSDLGDLELNDLDRASFGRYHLEVSAKKNTKS